MGKNAPLWPKEYNYGQQAVEYLFKMFKAFYPDISFLPDFYADEFNAYSWKDEKEMFVVVRGGLTRVKSLELAGLALIIGHEVGHLLGEPDETGEICEGTADYYAVGSALRKVFYQELYAQIYSELLPQIDKTFSYITKNRGVDKSCDNLNLDCRYKVYLAAGALENMPVCAGGPGLLGLEKAENTANGVVLTFNEALNAGTAQTVKNYQVEHAEDAWGNPKVVKATYAEEYPKQVTLTVEGLKTGNSYVVTVFNLLSIEGEPLDPNKNSAQFIA